MRLKINPKKRIFATGMTQSGKTTLVKLILNSVDNFLIYDVKGEYNHFGAVVFTLEDLKKAFASGCNKVVFRPQKDLSIELFDLVCGFVVDCLKNILFVVDEAQLFAPNMAISYHMKYIVSVMQSEGVGVLAISQRAQEVHKLITGNCGMVIAFKLHQAIDRKAVPIIEDKDIADLKQFEFLVFDESNFDEPVKKYSPLHL